MPVYGRVNPISIKDRLVFPGAPFWPKMKAGYVNVQVITAIDEVYFVIISLSEPITEYYSLFE